MFEMYSHKCMQESNVYLNKLHFSVVDVPFFLGEKKQDDVIICKLVQEQWNFNRKKHCNFVIRGIFWEILRDYTRHCILLLPMWNMTMQKLWPYQNLMHNLLSKDLWVKQFSLSVWNTIMVLDKGVWNLLHFPLLIICASVPSRVI